MVELFKVADFHLMWACEGGGCGEIMYFVFWINFLAVAGQGKVGLPPQLQNNNKKVDRF